MDAPGTTKNPRILPFLESTNYTTTAEVETIFSHELEDPGNARYFGVFLGFLVVFLGTAGNGVTVWAYLRNKNLQTSFNILIANLCLVELLFSIVVIPFNLPGFITGYNVYSTSFCSVVGYFYYSSLAASLYNLVAIAVNRYVGIVKSEKYQELFTGQRLHIIIITVWLVPALLYLPVVIGGGIQWRQNTLRCAIGDSIGVVPAIGWYNLILSIIFQAVPLVVLIILYTAIFHKVKQVKEKMKEHSKSFKRTASKIVREPSVASNTSGKNRSGNTSDDTGDEFKPSSLIEGLGLKPAGAGEDNNNSHITPSDEPSNLTLPKSPLTLEGEQSHEQAEGSPVSTVSYQTDKEEANRARVTKRKRNSIWALLLRNSQKINAKDLPTPLEKLDSPTISISTDQPDSEDDSQIRSPLAPSAEPENEPKLKEAEVPLRQNGIELKEFRRKKSLSVPNMPHFDFTNPAIARLTAETTSNTTTKKYLDVPSTDKSNRSSPNQSDSDSPMTRSKSTYKKRTTSERNSSRSPLNRARTQSDQTDPRKSKTSISIRIKRTTKELGSKLSMNADSDTESQHGHRPRIGTIARKVQERRARRANRDKRRIRKEKMLRRKHARERQLVYSSLMICVAFAACILPTSILYLVQAIADIHVSASAVLVISCIAWLHSVVNPLIYGYLNSQYRREYGRIAKCLKNRLVKPKSYSTKASCH